MSRHRQRKARRRRAHNARPRPVTVQHTTVIRDEVTDDFERLAQQALDAAGGPPLTTDLTGLSVPEKKPGLLDRVRRKRTPDPAPVIGLGQVDTFPMRRAFKGILTRREAYRLNDRAR